MDAGTLYPLIYRILLLFGFVPFYVLLKILYLYACFDESMIRYCLQRGCILCYALGVVCGKNEIYTRLFQSFLIRILGRWTRLQPIKYIPFFFFAYVDYPACPDSYSYIVAFPFYWDIANFGMQVANPCIPISTDGGTCVWWNVP